MTIIDCHAVFYNNNRVLMLNKFTPPKRQSVLNVTVHLTVLERMRR